MNSPQRRPRVLIADDHALIRSGLATLLRQWRREVSIAEVGNGSELVSLLTADSTWDVALVDLVMPHFAGESAVYELLTRFPAVPVIVISGLSEPPMIRRLLEAGVAGFLPKATDSPLVLMAIEMVLSGGRFIPPELLLHSPRERSAFEAADGANAVDITARQQEILALVRQGLPNKVIAARLRITEATVKSHVTGLLRAYGVNSRAALIACLK